MDKDAALLFFVYAFAFFVMILVAFIPDWIKRYQKRKAYKFYKLAQQAEYKRDPQLVRFYQRGIYHIAKAISEEEQIEQEDNFDGCAEAAIRIVNEQWASRDGGDEECRIS